MNFAGCIPLGAAVKSYVSNHSRYLSHTTVSQRFWLSAHWTQMLPSSSSFHVQSIHQKFVAPLCPSELQEREAVLTWKMWEEQQEQECCQLPFRERHGQDARAVHGMVRAGVIPATSTAPAVPERKGWSTIDVRGTFLPPQAPAAPHQPLSWVGRAAAAALPSVALGCTGLCFKTSHKNLSKEVS